MASDLARTAAVCAGLVLHVALDAQAQRTLRDPAPPKVHELAPIEPPTARPYDGLVTGATTKPRHPDAVNRDWPTFLGPAQDNQCRETHLLRDWPKGGPTLVWSMPRGQGFVTPVIQGERLVFTHRIENTIHIDCVHRVSGKRYWRRSFETDYQGEYFPSNNGPRSTPVIDGDRVYVHGLRGHLRCFELTTGRTIWARDLHAELGTVDDFFGVVSSPLIHGELLIQQLGAKKACAAAFDKTTGRLIWTAGDKWRASCTSPVVGLVHGKPRVFVLAGGDSRPPTGGLLVIDPTTGKVDFSHPFRSRLYLSVTSCCPLIGDDWVYLTNSYGVGSELLALAADGSFRQKWKNRRVGIQFSNPIRKDGHVYVIDGTAGRMGAIVCLDPETGKVRSRTELVWDETIEIDGKTFPRTTSIGEGSLLAADGDVLCLGDLGHLLWLRMKPEKTEVLARSWLFTSHETWTPPVVSHGLLYVSQNNPERGSAKPARLYCYDLRRGR